MLEKNRIKKQIFDQDFFHQNYLTKVLPDIFLSNFLFKLLVKFLSKFLTKIFDRLFRASISPIFWWIFLSKCLTKVFKQSFGRFFDQVFSQIFAQVFGGFFEQKCIIFQNFDECLKCKFNSSFWTIYWSILIHHFRPFRFCNFSLIFLEFSKVANFEQKYWFV